MCRSTVVGGVSGRSAHSRASSKVLSGLASSQTITSSIRSRKSTGIRSRVASSVEAALYATTTMPIRGSPVSRPSCACLPCHTIVPALPLVSR